MTIEEALNQAEIISDDESWVRIEKYPYKSFYEDEEETFIDLEKREISDPSKNVSTMGENNSQLITFVMNRYADGVDLVDMLIQIQYRLQSGEEATSGPVNVYASDDKIKFGWAISNIQTQSVQTIQFIIYCTGKLADGESYLLKTKPMSYRIENTLGIGGIIAKPDEDWFLQFENTMNEKLNQVVTLTDSAVQSANSARASEEATTQAAATVSNLAPQVKADAESAKASEENAEEWYNKTVEHSGVGYASKELAGVVSPQDVYVNPENGKMHMITTTDSTTQPNSYEGRLLIDEIGGVTEQDSTSGKNLLKNTAASLTNNGITYTVNNNGSITVNGTASAESHIDVATNVDLIGKEVILSGCPSGGGFGTYRIQVNGHLDASSYAIDSGSGVAITPSRRIDYVTIYITNGVTVSNLTFYPMIRPASIADATYEPYTGGIPAPNPSYPMEIKKSVVKEVRTHHKNFLDCRELTAQTIYGVTFTPKYDAKGNLQYIYGNGNASTTAYYKVGSVMLKKGEAYIISQGGNSMAYNMGLRDESGNNLYVETTNDKTEIAYTATEDITLFAFIRVYTGYSADGIKWYPMIRKADVTDDTYEPYTESSYTFSQPIELDGIGDVQDTIEDGAIKRRFASVVLDGSADENWALDAGNHAFYTFAIQNTGKPNTLPMCTHYSQATSSDDFSQDMTCAFNKNKVIWFKDNSVDTVADYKTRLASSPMTVIYELATETTEALPIADQIGLNSLLTYDGITYVEFIYDELEPTFKGKYGTSEVGGMTLESLLVARNNELRLAALEATNEEV